jgi:peroxidase
LDGNPGERDQPPNAGMRTEALKTIDDIRALVHKECGRTVSCADITVLAAREAVFLVNSLILLHLLFFFIHYNIFFI